MERKRLIEILNGTVGMGPGKRYIVAAFDALREERDRYKEALEKIHRNGEPPACHAAKNALTEV